jgi:cysteine desulfurase / selenocysteine lyase
MGSCSSLGKQMIEHIYSDFPQLVHAASNGSPLIYLDNAASTLKPSQVIRRISEFYEYEYSNVHRGVYPLAEQASALLECARRDMIQFLNGAEEGEVIFTSGTTDSINMVAHGYVLPHLKEGDEVVISRMEHHANWLPWQRVCLSTGAKLRIIELDAYGELDWQRPEFWTERVKFIAVSHVSNVLGAENPIYDLVQMARTKSIPILVDGAQALISKQVDLGVIKPDFYVFSGHKVFGPMGIGVLYIRKDRLNQMQPYRVGGGMVKKVSDTTIAYKQGYALLEAGTPNLAGIVGMVAGFNYLNRFKKDEIITHLQALGDRLFDQLSSSKHVEIYSSKSNHSGIISFNHKHIHPHDLATFLGERGVCVRAGHHCAQPLLGHFRTGAMVRVSFSIYNQMEEVDILMRALQDANRFFGYE